MWRTFTCFVGMWVLFCLYLYFDICMWIYLTTAIHVCHITSSAPQSFPFPHHLVVSKHVWHTIWICVVQNRFTKIYKFTTHIHIVCHTCFDLMYSHTPLIFYVVHTTSMFTLSIFCLLKGTIEIQYILYE
jgi:hypothetical protein